MKDRLLGSWRIQGSSPLEHVCTIRRFLCAWKSYCATLFFAYFSAISLRIAQVSAGICKVLSGNIQCLHAGIPILIVDFALLAAEAILQEGNLLLPVLHPHLDAAGDEGVFLGVIRHLEPWH